MRRVAAVSLLAVVLTACGTTPAPTASGVMITNCGKQVSYDHVPTRAVSNDINTTEMMFALGLGDHMAGYAGVEDKKVQSPYANDFTSVRRISDKYITKEVLLGASPDFVFAGYGYGFSEATGVTPESLNGLKIPTYQLTEACRQDGRTTRGVTDPIEAAFTDLLNLGRIFGVQDRAEKLVAQQRKKIADVARTPARAKVFHYDCCGDKQPLSSGRFAAPDSIIASAGGENVFADVADSWIHVSWEEVVARRPEVITINAADDAQAKQMEDFLMARPELAGLPAIQHRRFFVLPYANWVSGVRNADSVVSLAGFLSRG